MIVEELLFDVAEALRVPVLALALVSLAVVVVEAGALVAEVARRSGRSLTRLEVAVGEARTALAAGNEPRARAALRPIEASAAMRETVAGLISERRRPDSNERFAKRLAEFDYRCLRRLERTRILVRAGPALGLMGTLIPLSPALVGLAAGDVEQLAENLRVAFSVTVAGLLVGAIAFAVSLVRDRLYGQDYSDLEYVATGLAGDAGGSAVGSGADLERAGGSAVGSGAGLARAGG